MAFPFGSFKNSSYLCAIIMRIVMKRIIKCILIVQALLCVQRAGAQTYSGTVFCDRNQNGVQDQGEKGVKGMPVSNGDTIVLTDRQGRYSLPRVEGCSVFPILPADYTMAGSRVVNANFAYMGSATQGKADFAVVRKSVNKCFRLNALGDVQVGNYQELEYATRTLWPELLEPSALPFPLKCKQEPPVVNLFLGDLVNNRLGLYDDLRKLIEQLPQQSWTVLGNHDRDADTLRWRQTRTYCDKFGADMYAFNEGSVHFIVLNNVYADGLRGYKNHLSERQLRFVEQDLRHVPADRLIVLSMHIPLAFTDNRAELIRLLAGRGEVLAITAHLHQVERFFHEGDGVHIQELGAGATCGFWWVGERDADGVPAALQQEGTPRNYFIVDFSGTRYRMRCKAIGKDMSRQMTIHVTGIDTLDNYLRDMQQLPKGMLMLNVYGGSDSTAVRCRVDGGEWTVCQKQMLMDPNTARIRELNLQKVYPTQFNRINPIRNRKSHQIWTLQLPPALQQGAHYVEVEAEDRWGFRATGCRSFCFPRN